MVSYKPTARPHFSTAPLCRAEGTSAGREALRLARLAGDKAQQVWPGVGGAVKMGCLGWEKNIVYKCLSYTIQYHTRSLFEMYT